MKRIVSVLLVCMMLVAMTCIGVSATSKDVTHDETAVQLTTEEIAYMDISSADDAMKDSILAARKEIIFSKEWVADEYTMCVMDAEGNVKRNIPKFSEIFPDWELPKIETNTKSVPNLMKPIEDEVDVTTCTAVEPTGLNDWLYVGGMDVYLHQASSELAEPYAHFYTDVYDVGTMVGTCVTQLTSSETCNIGYSDYDTGVSIGYVTELSMNEWAVIGNVGDMNIGIRASTFSNPGWSYLETFAANRYGILK